MPPPAAVSGAWSRVQLSFSEQWTSQLYGFDAQLRGRAEVHHGQLVLVDYDPERQRKMVGSLVVALPQPAVPPTCTLRW